MAIVRYNFAAEIAAIKDLMSQNELEQALERIQKAFLNIIEDLSNLLINDESHLQNYGKLYKLRAECYRRTNQPIPAMLDESSSYRLNKSPALHSLADLAKFTIFNNAAKFDLEQIKSASPQLYYALQDRSVTRDTLAEAKEHKPRLKVKRKLIFDETDADEPCSKKRGSPLPS
jgi:hypothetical protein